MSTPTYTKKFNGKIMEIKDRIYFEHGMRCNLFMSGIE